MTKNVTNEVSTDEISIDIVQERGISIVWFVPLIALVFGAWLAIKSISEQGEFITIELESGRGVIANKTEVRYKGLVAGMVKKVGPSENLQHVIAEVEMSDKFAPYLTHKALFWLVTADVSLKGVSGLDTLLSGDYINMQPDIDSDGYTIDRFMALSAPPPLDLATPGLHLTLLSDVLGSISIDSPILFKQMPIGYVSGYQYVEQNKKVNINIYIEEKFAHLVKENSQFWNSSGVQIVASLSAGLKVNTDSLASIIAGGISVGTLPYQMDLSTAKSGSTFDLHPDFQSAEMGHEIELVLGWNSGIDRGASILYQGVTLGVVESFTSIDPQKRQIIAKAKVNPRIVPYLTNESQFYVIAPKVDLSGVSNAESLLTGTYIGIRPSLSGTAQNTFNVFNTKPAYNYDEPGLHLILNTHDRASIQAGTAIYYKQQAVGSVQAVETVGPDQHLIHIHIEEPYQGYVAADSHFWDTSGVSISGNLQGIKLQANSLSSIVSGGISFDNGYHNDNVMAKNGDGFRLFANSQYAEQRINFTLQVPLGLAISDTVRIMYRGQEVGSIHEIIKDGTSQVLSVGILPEYEYILTKLTQFWFVKAQLSLSGLADIDAIVGGSYITFDAIKAEDTPSLNERQTAFVLSVKPPEKHESSLGLQLQLIAEHATAASPGSPVSYRGITIGQVDNVELHSEEDHIHINITVDEEYQYLISGNTRFYNAGGLSISGGLTQFMVKTESADALLRGGISFYNPEDQEAEIAVKEKDKFTLFDHLQGAQNAGLAITVYFEDIRGLKIDTKVTYQEQVVGAVQRLVFEQNKEGVTAIILLNDTGRKYAVQGSKFWLEKTEIGLVGTKNITGLFDGGSIAIIAGKGANKTSFFAETTPPVIEFLPYGLNVKLVSARLGSVRIGNPVLYRQVQVGEVIGVGLADSADKVNVFINVATRYAKLVTPQSQFWNTSGFSIEAGIFSGVDIHSESVETLLSGGIAFSTPENNNDSLVTITEQGHEFILNAEMNKNWLDWNPKIDISSQ